MDASKTARTVIGILCALLGFALLVGGVAVLWAQLALRDNDGFYESGDYRLNAAGNAVTLDSGDVGANLPLFGADRTSPVTIRLRVTDQASAPVFVGIARPEQAESYLRGVAHSEVTDLDERGGVVSTRVVEGTATPAQPGEQTFWATSVAGSGTQTLTWPVQPGRWTLVVMNVSGASGVNIAASAGAQIAYLTEIGLGLLVGALLVLLAGAAALFAHRRGPGGPADAAVIKGLTSDAEVDGESVGTYPVRVEASFDPATSRWLWLVKWFLAIPHLIVLAFLWVAFVILTTIAAIAILFTGRYPRGLFDFNVGVLRWTWRVGYYAFLALGTDRYPPFSLAATDYPASLEVAYPERLSRGLVLVKSWLLAIPHLLIVAILIGSAGSFGLRTGIGVPLIVGGGLIGLLVLIAGVHLAVLARYPSSLFGLVVGLNRWVLRVGAYVGLMTDEYPPFRLDQGGTERPAAEPTRATAATP